MHTKNPQNMKVLIPLLIYSLVIWGLANLPVNVITNSYAMGNMGGNGNGNGGGNNGGNQGQGGGNANAGGNNPNAGGNNPKAQANKNKNKTTTTVVKSISKRKGKTVYTPKYYHTVRIRLFESDWITLDVDGLAYSNDTNSRNRFGEINSMVTFNLHKLWERRKQEKEMKQNLDYAAKHYKMIQQEDGSWLIKER